MRGGDAPQNCSSFDWLALVALAVIVAPLCLASTTNETMDTTEVTNGEQDDAFESEEIAPVVAVLFPAFTLTIGVVVFYILSRQ